MPDLTCYRLRRAGPGPVQEFDDAIAPDKLESTTRTGPIQIEGATAKLYVVPSAPHDPEWAKLLRAGFGEDIVIPPVGGAAAVMIVRVLHEGNVEHLAFSFGQGRYLLRNDAYERGFGLKTALNVTFEGDTGDEEIDPARLRSVDAKRIGQNVLRTRHQVAEADSLEGLDVDARRELLRGVTGIPVDQEVWGSRIMGSDALGVFLPGGFPDIGSLCERILAAYFRTDYQVRFAFVDDLKAITDPLLRTFLEEELLGMLLAAETEAIDLAPPELVDWERTSRFQYHSESRKNILRRELRLTDYLGSLSEDKLEGLTREKLRSNEIRAVGADGLTVDAWPVWRCLYGEVELEGKTYILDDGDFFEISETLLGPLDADLESITEFSGTLPDWVDKRPEDEYNLEAASSNPHYLLLDRRSIRITRQTSAIEICDVLTDTRSWIHVKKRTDGSKALSHLFWQGFVSGTLLLGEVSFRKKALEKIKLAEKERAEAENDASYVGRFQIIDEGSVTAADHEVVFAILGKWGDDGLLGLPFFSKLTLRETVNELLGRGLRVSVKMVQAA